MVLMFFYLDVYAYPTNGRASPGTNGNIAAVKIEIIARENNIRIVFLHQLLIERRNLAIESVNWSNTKSNAIAEIPSPIENCTCGGDAGLYEQGPNILIPRQATGSNI